MTKRAATPDGQQAGALALQLALASNLRPIAIPKITPMQIFVTLWY
jgi:hypothetical protein